MVDFGCRFFHGLVPIFSRFRRDINGEKKSRYWWSFSRLVFHSLPPLDKGPSRSKNTTDCKLTIRSKPRGPQDWKFQSREAILKKSSFQCGMKFSNREWLFHSGALSGRRKTGLGIEIFNREWNFQTENEHFKREWKFRAWGNVCVCVFFFFFMRSSENEFFRFPRPLGIRYGGSSKTLRRTLWNHLFLGENWAANRYR